MAIHTESLTQKHCVPCQGGGQALRGEALDAMLRQTPLWELVGENRIAREFKFAGDAFGPDSRLYEYNGRSFLAPLPKKTEFIINQIFGGIQT